MDADFPRRAAAYCLEEGGIDINSIEFVGFYDKPLLKFERMLETYLGIAPRGFRSFLMAVWSPTIRLSIANEERVLDGASEGHSSKIERIFGVLSESHQ